MSIAHCEHCDEAINTDLEVDCFVDDGVRIFCLCANCQEAAWVRHQERLMEET